MFNAIFTEVHITLVVVAVFSAFVLSRVLSLGYQVSQWNGKDSTSKYLAFVFYGVAAEIALATVATFLLDHLWLWCAIRVIGRIVELYFIGRLIRHLTKRPKP